MDGDSQQFSLRWHNHQSSVISALSCMLNTGALADVTLSASGANLKAHRLVLASCSQYFAQLFRDVESENGAMVIVLACEVTELKMLLTFMYTGEVTASRNNLPALLRLAQNLKVSGLTHADTVDTNPTTEIEEPQEDLPHSPNDMELKNEHTDSSNSTIDKSLDTRMFDNFIPNEEMSRHFAEASLVSDLMLRSEKERLSKLDQIVQNLYSSHKINSAASVPVPISNVTDTVRPTRYNSSTTGAVCGICHKRLSNAYNLRVHMDTHAAVRHRCHACTHVSRSRDALRKHVAYRHPHKSRQL